MSKGDLLDYIDSILSEMGRNLDNYRRQHNRSSAVMLKESALAIAVMATELNSRI
jgi:hypothetical protein